MLCFCWLSQWELQGPGCLVFLWLWALWLVAQLAAAQKQFFLKKMLLVCSLVGAFLVGWLELSLAVCFPPGFWLQGPSLLVGFSSARLFASCGAAL